MITENLEQSETLGNEIVFTAKCYVKYMKHKILAFLLLLLIPIFIVTAIYMGIIIARVNSIMFFYLGLLSILSFIPFGCGLAVLYDTIFRQKDYFSLNSMHIIGFAVYMITVNEAFLLIYASHYLFDFYEYFIRAVGVNIVFAGMYSILFYFANITTAKAGIDKKLELEGKYERKIFEQIREITGNIASQSKHKHYLDEQIKKTEKVIIKEDIGETSILRYEQYQREIKLLEREVKDIEHRVARSKDVTYELSKRYTDLRSEYSNFEAEHFKCIGELDKLETEYCTGKQQTSLRRKEISDLDRDLSASKRDQQEIQERIITTRRAISCGANPAVAETEYIERTIKEYQTIISGSNQQVQKIRDEIQKALTTERKRRAGLQRVKNVVAKYKSYEEDWTQSAKRNKQIRSKIEICRRVRAGNEGKVKRLTLQIKEIEKSQSKKIDLSKKDTTSTSNKPNQYHQRIYTPQKENCFTSVEAKITQELELAEYNKAFYGDSNEISYRICSCADIAIEEHEVRQTIKLEIAEIISDRATFINIYKLQKILGNKHNYTFPKWYLTEILDTGMFTKELHYKEGIKIGYFGLKEWEK